MNKTVYAVPNEGCWSNFTAGKRYLVVSEICENNWKNFTAMDDTGHVYLCSWINSSFGGGDWIRIEEEC